MRLLHILLLACGTALVHADAIRFSSKTHPNFNDDPDPEPIHRRVKRALYGVLGFTSACDPGWTGQFCENPVCSDNVTLPPQNTYSVRDVDYLQLPSGCTGRYYVPVDSQTQYIIITIYSGGIPIPTLTDTNGNVVNASSMTANAGLSYTSYIIPPGGYQLTVNIGDDITTESCTVNIQASSSLSTIHQLVQTPQDDIGPYEADGIVGTPLYIASHAFNLNAPGQIKALTVRKNAVSNSVIYRAAPTLRYGCAYQYFAGAFDCPSTLQFLMQADGIDANGFPFRRSMHFTCVNRPVTTTTTPATTSPTVLTCQNGGTGYPSKNPQYCSCPELFSGTHCEIPNCMNHGILNLDNKTCSCELGYWGDNCQHLTCDPNVGQYLTDYKTLVVVVRNTPSMQQYYSGIYNAVVNAVGEVGDAQSLVYFNYVLVRFADGTYLTHSYNNYADFLTDLQNLNTTQLTEDLCKEVTFDAIYSVFLSDVFDKSPIFLFSNAVPSDVDNWRMVTEANTRRALPIYSFFMPRNISSCPFDPLSEGYRSLLNAVLFSGGMAFNPKGASGLAALFQYAIRGTTSQMNLVYADDLYQCVSSGFRSFVVDSSTEDLIIMATGTNFIFRLWSPDNLTSTVMPVFNDNFDYMWDVNKGTQQKVGYGLTGQYYMSYQTADPQNSCSIRVMARSKYDLFFGTTMYDYLDVIDTQPVVGVPMAFVAQLNGLVNATADPFRLFSELSIRSNMNNENQVAKPMYYSNGKYRDGCGFHLFFGFANFCEFPDQMFYATVFADDNNGFAIQRTSIGYCSLSYITAAPPGTCQNGGVFSPYDNKTCLCVPGFTGDYCQQIVCQNGGTPAGIFCVCPGGTSGTFCEQYACVTPNVEPPTSMTAQSMIFVVSATSQMQDAWNRLSAGINDFVKDIETANPGWIKTWTLLVPSNLGVELILTQSYAPNDFINAVQTVAANLQNYINGTDCTVQLFEAINYAVLYSEKRSSVYVFTASEGVVDDDSYSSAYFTAAANQIAINLIGVGSTVCLGGANQGQFDTATQDLAYYSSGFVYMTNHVEQILPYITTMYNSAISGQGGDNEDCTGGFTNYFAVDGFTQSLTLAVTGNIIDVTVTLPDGSRPDSYELQLVNDPLLVLRQYIIPCEPGWNSQGQYCYHFAHGADSPSWYTGALNCHASQSSLVNIYSQATDDYLKSQTIGVDFWIGLTRHNNSWIWDVVGSTTTKYLDPSYAPWCTGFPTANTSLNCVLQTSSGCWQNRDCQEGHAYVCQMHTYGRGFEPSDPAQDRLPGGRWAVTVTTSSGGCFAEFRAQSLIQVFFGFTQDPTGDFPDFYANSDASQNYIVANPVWLSPFDSDVNPSMEGRLNYAAIMATSASGNVSNVISQPLVMGNRWGCGYPFISQAFKCPSDGFASSFGVWFSGIDQFGFAFERYSDALCNKYVVSCVNGFKDPTSGMCVCSPGYTGQKCEIPICTHGNLDANTQQCSCDFAWTGPQCDLPLCEPPYPQTFKETDRTLAIALETSYLMGSTVTLLQRKLQDALSQVVNDPSSPGWFSNFILYPFDSTTNKASWYPVTVSNNYQDIVAAVQNMTVMCPPNGVCSSLCERPIMGVIKSILTHPSFTSPNSVVLVVTRSAPEDYSGDLTPTLLTTKAQINFALTAVSSPCGQGWNTNAATQMYNVVSYSDGNIFVMTPSDLVKTFIPQYIPSLYKSAGLESGSLSNCSQGDILFQVEHDMYEFTIDYYSPVTDPPFTITLTDPAGDFLMLPQSIITSDTNYLGVIRVNDTGATRAGTYRLRIKGASSAFCYLNIRGRSSVVLYPGFVVVSDQYNGATNDNAHFYPILNENNLLVVHAEGLQNGGSLTYAQYVSQYGLQHTTSLLPRDSKCGFEWYANLPYECYDANFLVVVYGKDAKGGIFHRNYIMSCVSTRPPAPPPPALCNRNNALQEFVFIIDSSVTATADGFQMMKGFVGNTMVGYNIGSGTQVGAVTVADQGYPGFLFNDSTSSNTFSTNLKNLQFINVAGQNTGSALQMVINNYNSDAPGYSTDPNARHSVIYVTATNPTDDDPAALPTTLKRSGLYGLAVVTYNMTASSGLLSMTSSNCIYQASSSQDLLTYGVNFVQQLTCVDTPPCNMGGRAPQ